MTQLGNQGKLISLKNFPAFNSKYLRTHHIWEIERKGVEIAHLRTRVNFHGNSQIESLQ